MNRRKVLFAGAAVGVLALVSLILLLAAVVTGSMPLAIAAGATAVITAIGTAAGAILFGRRSTQRLNELRTQIRNVERRQETRFEQTDSERRAQLTELETQITDLRRLQTEKADDVDGMVSQLREELQDQRRTSEREATVAMDQIESLRNHVNTSHQDLSAEIVQESSRLEKHTAAVADGLRESVRRVEAITETLNSQLATTRADLAGSLENADRLRETVKGHRKQLATFRQRVPSGKIKEIQRHITSLDHNLRGIDRRSIEHGHQLGWPTRSMIDANRARDLIREDVADGRLLETRPLLEAYSLTDTLNLAELRKLYRFFRTTGYWDTALTLLNAIFAASGREGDGTAALKVHREVKTYLEPIRTGVELPPGPAHDPSGPILHFVGRVLPTAQTGYTLRTQYTARAQADEGLRPIVVGQSGAQGSDEGADLRYTIDGIEYIVLPGAPRTDLYLDRWMEQDIQHLADVVREVRPSVLHAHSDFFNGAIAVVVARHFDIPIVYESRGFWEESWLSRVVTAQGWKEAHTSVFEAYGLPFAYTARRDAERLVRSEVDHVFTLAEVMRDHILSSAESKADESRVSIVPNAVDPGQFPVQVKDPNLAAETGIPQDALVIGYISSLVEYEGIDVLIEGFRRAQEATDREVCLLLVGDGDKADSLRDLAAQVGVENVIFTGRVPHDQILGLYGLIDVFVVPRSKSTVTDLVTPLKPFEAFSTGRTLVMSDVGALREIAQQSGAVETFCADDPDDLSQVLLSLIDDAQLRADLAERGASWVRQHRAWQRNVGEYLRVYKSLGYQGATSDSSRADAALRDRGGDPGALIEGLTVGQLSPLNGWFRLSHNAQDGRDLLLQGWKFKEFDRIPVRDLVSLEDWAQYGRHNRSWGFNLHTWSFLDPLLFAYDDDSDPGWLHNAVKIAVNWIACHDDPDDETDEMAWYDMSLALRVPRLVALAQRCARAGTCDSQMSVLGEALSCHLDELARDRAFNPRTNHGFYTAASQVHAAKYVPFLPGADLAHDQGQQRLSVMVHSQFAADGTHKEHSTEYHRMLLESFERALNDGLIQDDEVSERVRRAAEVLGWMVQPDGRLAQLGDSPAKTMVRPSAESVDPVTRFVLTDGASGEPPTQEMAVYEEGGYAFVRSPKPLQPGELHRSGYLAFSAAFHSRAHKHADDLTVIWHDRGQDILVDSGRYGYGDLLPADSPLRNQGFYYADPERQYVEGTIAHNTLMMDGKDQERRDREPYGSGITECVERDGVFDLSGRVRHNDYVHRRRLVFRPGQDLLIKDSVYSQSPEPREAIIWFNLAGHFELDGDEDALLFRSTIGDGTLLCIHGEGELVEPVRGQSRPMRGWRSVTDRSLEPSWSFGFRLPVKLRASCETKFQWA